MTAKPAISLSRTKGRQPVYHPAREQGFGKRDTQKQSCVGDVQEGLATGKKISGYHSRSLAETAMYRFK